MSFGFGGGASSQSLFGAQQSSQSLFAASQPTQNLFGNPQSSSAGLFGNPQSSANLFGNPQSSSANLFGNQQSAASSLFGNPQSSSAGLFGNAQSSSAGLFGNPQSSSGSLFGSSQPASGLFGAASSSASLFASSSSFGGGGLFGATSQSGLFSTQQSAPSLFAQPQQQVQQPQQVQLPRVLTDLVEQLNPLHPQSPFHVALYNIVPQESLSRYTRPTDFDEALWTKALAQNPDPSRMVPVQANNIDDLLERADVQTQRIAQHIGVLERLGSELKKMEEDVEANLERKLAMYRRSHRELARKLLRVAAVVDAAVRRGGGGMTGGESDRKRRVELVARALGMPAEFRDKLADLVEVAKGMSAERGAGVGLRDAETAGVVMQVLQEQLNGIQYLGEVCEKVERDCGIITKVISNA